ncbi:MAG: DUF1653 domain-containing protein [Candidatus Moraniibacteriota bacterium]
MQGNKSLPENTPKVGEAYRHYKGDSYRVKLLAFHSNDGEWMVVYEPLYENPAASLFTRPLREWHAMVEWEGRKVLMFTLLNK